MTLVEGTEIDGIHFEVDAEECEDIEITATTTTVPVVVETVPKIPQVTE